MVPLIPRGKKSYPPPGIGRGHSSLPPKPGFPGKPLPRDTDAIVLTPGAGDNLAFTPSPKAKRIYSLVTSEAGMRPMDPAVTNLTPQNRISPSASSTNHHCVPQSITPPAENGSTVKGVSIGNPQMAGADNVLSFIGAPLSPPSGSSIQANAAVDSFQKNFDHEAATRREHGQQTQAQSQTVNFQSNGAPPPDMYPTMGSLYSITHPHHQYHHPAGFFHHPYHGRALTPPNTGTIFTDHSTQPQTRHVFNELGNSPENANGPLQQQKHDLFGPVYGGFRISPNETSQAIAPPVPIASNMTVRPTDEFQLPIDSPKQDASNVTSHSKSSSTTEPTQIKNISFVPVGDEGVASAQGGQDPTRPSFMNEHVKDRAGQPLPPSTGLESYISSQFLNDKLADVSIVLVNPNDNIRRQFPAHSFVLGRSEKLSQLLEHALNPTVTGMQLSMIPSCTFGSYEGEDEELLMKMRPIRATRSDGDRDITITFRTTVDPKAFLAVMKVLYSASHWEINALLDPNHPGHCYANETSLTTAARPPGFEQSPKLQTLHSNTSHSSQQVQMLEKSIETFCAAVLLGLDEVVFEAINHIKRWGLALEGGAFERLIQFLIDDSQRLQMDQSLSSQHWMFVEPLLDEATALFARNIPAEFKLDPRVPTSPYITRFGNNWRTSPLQTRVTTPVGQDQHQRIVRQAHSTILLSLPFMIMKGILEHDLLAVVGRKQRFDLAASVVQERERRRKRELRLFLDESTNRKDNGRNSVVETMEFNMAEKPKDCTDVLFWEESAVSTFGHGGIGIEIARRRKGGPGGRMLWKVGKREPT
jgi:hypothetical protein